MPFRYADLNLCNHGKVNRLMPQIFEVAPFTLHHEVSKIFICFIKIGDGGIQFLVDPVAYDNLECIFCISLLFLLFASIFRRRAQWSLQKCPKNWTANLNATMIDNHSCFFGAMPTITPHFLNDSFYRLSFMADKRKKYAMFGED